MQRNKSKTLNRSIEILSLFSEERPSLNIKEIVDLLHIPQSTVYRLVQTLTGKGLLDSIGKGLYQPGWRTVELARIINEPRKLAEVAMPFMEKLARKTRESVILTGIYGTKVIVIDHIDSPHNLKLSYTTGQQRSLYKSASSKIIFAYLKSNHQKTVLDQLNNESSVTELEKEINLIKKQGFCVTESEVDNNARGIAAPIFRKNNTITAGLSIAGPVFRLDNSRVSNMIDLVCWGAEEITKILQIEGTEI